ncbi:unnamed protein product [Adineta steineri]|uniref:OTU domain-containing protein n=2 Tax=Adineta steineri TaxID=433720 RepID=A0A815RCN2_9BILA|nr:unnamed protein product [Adineta steineri]
MELMMTPLEYRAYTVFDERIHVMDIVAKQYLESASADVHHLIPVDVPADGNCLYHSVLISMNNSTVTTSELRVRTIVELITNETFYSNMYANVVGPIDIAIKGMCKNFTYSELYEICALCTVLGCNIRSVYPKIDFHPDMAVMNNIFTPAPSVTANYEITILWSHAWDEMHARAVNNNIWSPNHFVPLMSPSKQYQSDHNNQLMLTLTTPEKKTYKNNAVVQIRIPEFSSSPSGHLRSEADIESENIESTSFPTTVQDQTNIGEQRQTRLSLLNERARSRRRNETTQQTQDRLAKVRERTQSRRANETEKQTQTRLEKNKERAQSIREGETDEQYQSRIDRQRKRSQSNRNSKKVVNYASDNETVQQQNINVESNEKENSTLRSTDDMDNIVRNENMTKKKKSQIHSTWPAPIPTDLKKECLQQFLSQMSMSVLAEVTCAVCNIRTPEQESIKMPMSEIPNIHLLKISDELKNLVINTQSSTSKNSNGSSTSKSSYFYYANDIILYVNGIYQENNMNMCILCQKCSNGLSKEQIPKFSVANNMWLGDIPVELQGLTIPEEKLISLHRHNSCIIKLQSPFHSMATAQGALKGNCITFLQNTPNIVNSLPLKMADLCDTLRVIFIGARPPERLQLKRVLTVRKKKIVEALRWLKKYNILYKNVDINLDNIAQLPEDDIPEPIMTTMEQILNNKEVPSERVGYIPDPLSNSTELNISDVIPVNNSAVLDVNGSSISSEKINDYLLKKIKNDGTNDEMDVENIYLIPHSSKPVNEYFNPKLLAGLYPTLFCYGLGAPEDQSRPLTINLREHIRYLLSYNDRRFEKNHSFIFVVFNLLQRRDACFHAQLIATKPYFRSSAQEIYSLNTSDIEAALKNISTRTYNTGSNKALLKLLNHIKTIGGRVMGSAYSRTSLRTHLHAMIFNQSLPNIFLTFNPADIHSPVALYFAGVKLDLDNVQAKQLIDAYKRAKIIASHPVATLKTKKGLYETKKRFRCLQRIRNLFLVSYDRGFVPYYGQTYMKNGFVVKVSYKPIFQE